MVMILHNTVTEKAKSILRVIKVNWGTKQPITCAQMNFLDEDASGSGDDANMQDGNKNHSGIPSSSGCRKRSRKATGDAIVDAMLEIAAASKMRAAAIVKSEERFSISKCIKVLDDMSGIDQQIYFWALDLFENSNVRETFISLRSEKRLPWLQRKFSASSN
ncbi:uncharacterized protein LOC126593136 isoform X7 [Malus sylvestris]|nr:uncharacterized protein LOC126593136 isoform X7 [Malus sylvestris]